MQWVRQLFTRRSIYRDLSEEIRQHLAEKIEALMADGMSRKEAEYAAKREFGNVTRIEESGYRIRQERLSCRHCSKICVTRFETCRSLRDSPWSPLPYGSRARRGGETESGSAADCGTHHGRCDRR